MSGPDQERQALSGGCNPGRLVLLSRQPNKASELGRIGGRANRHVLAEAPDPLPELNTVTAVRDTINRLITDVYAGRLHQRIAAGLVSLMRLQLRAIEKTDIEHRIARVEKMLANIDR